MHRLLARLLETAPVVTDGAWGTRLQTLGLSPGEPPDGWNLSHPDRVEAVARAYVEAGSRIILTNTFGASRPRLAAHGLADRTAEINRAGAAISRRAAAGRALVFAAIGPTGKLASAGEVEETALLEAFDEQARALADGGADGIVVETMADLAEARAAVTAAVRTGLPVVACMVFDAGKDGDRTMMGITPERAATSLADAGADVIGANCGRDVDAYVGICRRFRSACALPLWIKPNAGLPELVGGRPVYRMTPETFESCASALREAGASFLGGCCGTDPAFIRALARGLDKSA